MIYILIVIFILFLSIFIFWIYNIYNEVNQYFKNDFDISELKINNSNNNKIFISIASYRDTELLKTVKSLIYKADNPKLLKIVIYEQDDKSIENQLNNYEKSLIKILYDHYNAAKGPTWARYLIQREYDGEEYFMQIDSHMRTVNSWDTILKNMLKRLPNKSVLTQYPPNYDINNDENLNINIIRSGLYIQGFGPNDLFTRIQSDQIDINKKDSNFINLNIPFQSKAWAACFSFSKSDILIDAPYDPYLPFLFFGEELDITLRLFTKGWYFYSPNITVIFTTFNRSYRRTMWDDSIYYLRKLYELTSGERLRNRLGFNNQFYIGTIIDSNKYIDNFKLGNIRSIEDYKKFSNIKSFDNQLLDIKCKSFRRKTTRNLLK